MRRQRGIALLALTTLMVVVGSGAMLEGLTELVTGAANEPDRHTVEVLAEAKVALLTYAMNGATRPGELPCPDADFDGESAEGGGSICATYRGWLPYKTLGLTELLDADDERLWYGVSSAFHSGGLVPLNSDTEGQLTLNGSTDDIVAVIISPHAPIDSDCLAQADGRPAIGNARDADDEVAAFLESANASGDLTTYVTDAAPCGDGSATHNDQIVAITRAELMAVVEKRVLDEIADRLELYRVAAWNTEGVYPWLATLADPQVSPFKSSAGTTVGFLPYHEPGESFSTALSMRWNIQVGTVLTQGSVADSDLVPVDPVPVDPAVGITLNFTAANTDCTWTTISAVDCTATLSPDFDALCMVEGTPQTVSVRRTFNFLFESAIHEVVAPSAGTVRQRNAKIRVEDPLPVPPLGSSAKIIEVVDQLVDAGELGQLCGGGSLTVAPGSEGYINAEGIRLDLVLGSDLPSWIVDERWHHYAYVALSPVAKPGGAPEYCVSGNTTDCLTMAGMNASMDKKAPALVVAAGPELATQTRSTWNFGDYFESYTGYDGNYANGQFRYVDGNGQKPPNSEVFNDQVHVVALP